MSGELGIRSIDRWAYLCAKFAALRARTADAAGQHR